jgi:hypothetical protein
MLITTRTPGVGLTNFAHRLHTGIPNCTVLHTTGSAAAASMMGPMLEDPDANLIIVLPPGNFCADDLAPLVEVVAQHRDAPPDIYMLIRGSMDELGDTDLMHADAGFGARRIFRRTHAEDQMEAGMCTWNQVEDGAEDG